MQCDLHERLGACPPLSAYITIISAFTTAPQSSLLLNILNILFISYSIEMHCDVIYVWVPAARSVRTLHSSAHLLLPPIVYISPISAYSPHSSQDIFSV
jgi:hypothetical protein